MSGKHPRLARTARNTYKGADESRSLLISDISLWEIAMLIARGRIRIDKGTAEFLRLVLDSRSYQVVGISPEIAEMSVSLGARINGDPADRLVVATAMTQRASLVTADRNLRSAGVPDVIW